MSKEIEFIPMTKEEELLNNPPVSSKSVIPEWYKKIHPYTNGDEKLRFPMGTFVPNLTVKRCIPFLDALSFGYTYLLSDDLYVEQVNQKPFIRWRSSAEVISWHDDTQFNGFPISDDYAYMVAKWESKWKIKTPKGYSVHFSHPSNRIDLPFRTLTGVVDCDVFPIFVNFPFVLKKGFEGVISAGTPVVQLLPFKRDSWVSKVKVFNAEDTYKDSRLATRVFVNSYKSRFWNKKRFD